MTRYYLIPKNVRNLPPDTTESLSVAFDEDLPCKGDFSMEKKGRDIQLVIILFIKIYMGFYYGEKGLCANVSLVHHFPDEPAPNTSLWF
jgi:hypothetical protein